MKYLLPALISICLALPAFPQPDTAPASKELGAYLKPVKWRNIGPFRGGRSVTATGVVGDPITYYMGTTGGGLWKTTDAGQHWNNISDGFFETGSVGAVAVSPNDPNVIYVGMGEHAVRGVMSSYGNGVYKSTDAGKTWKHMGLELTRVISEVRIHPTNSDLVYVAAQGATHGATTQRGVYMSTDGGVTWDKTLYVDENSGCADLAMDPNNPRILYAAMWDHRRLPWQVVSGGPGSGLYKSTDGGVTWGQLKGGGLPKELGKMSVSVTAANSNKIYALIESDSDKEQGGLFVSKNAGQSWSRASKDHRLVQRAWYYIEVFADPNDENTVYVLNTPGLKSTDGGKTWSRLSGTHGDYHDLWFNPDNSENIVIANDGGAAISFDGGGTFSTQSNMPTAQFYRLNVDNNFPYRIYAGQQDNSSVRIESRNLTGRSITERNWTSSAGGESAFLGFDPDNPRYVMGGSYQGSIELLDSESDEGASIMAAPHQFLAMNARDMAYRFNWNAPIIWSQHEANTFYHGGNKLLKTADMGVSWTEVSPDLTRNDSTKQGKGGAPYTNEGAGGENYGTLSYVLESPHEAGVIWTGSDDGLVHVTQDNGKNWINVTPKGLTECLINAIEVSPHDPATVYIATTKYKFNDFSPGLFKSTNYGKTWTKINTGIPYGAYTRVVREDPGRPGLLFAGTETGIYVSFNAGSSWSRWNSNLPITPINDLLIRHDDVIAATSGRSFWILDDLEMVRSYNAELSETTLFKPADTYRVSGGSEMNSNSGDGMNVKTGVNPASGMVIYYHLTASDSTEVTLEILDESGAIVNTYSSEKAKDIASYPGSPSAPPTLSATAGLNRFVWNLAHPTLTDAPKVYIEGSFGGHRATPGNYQLVLKVNGKVSKTPAKILANPMIKASEGDYLEQDILQKSIAKAVNEIHGSLNRLQEVKNRIDAVTKRLRKSEKDQALIDQGKKLSAMIDTWDKKLVQRKSQAYDDVINFPNGLTADYLFLKGQASRNTPTVTAPMKARLKELNAKWTPLKKTYETEIEARIKAFETALSKAGVGILR